MRCIKMCCIYCILFLHIMQCVVNAIGMDKYGVFYTFILFKASAFLWDLFVKICSENINEM